MLQYSLQLPSGIEGVQENDLPDLDPPKIIECTPQELSGVSLRQDNEWQDTIVLEGQTPIHPPLVTEPDNVQSEPADYEFSQWNKLSLNRKKVPELRAMCKHLLIEVGGTKAQLIDRLLEFASHQLGNQ